jgi:5-methylcytosine-specific restriction endonuclease McrA
MLTTNERTMIPDSSNYIIKNIDHIVPDSWFEYNTTKCDGFKKSWALDNLQPLWAKDNLRKGNRFVGGLNA